MNEIAEIREKVKKITSFGIEEMMLGALKNSIQRSLAALICAGANEKDFKIGPLDSWEHQLYYFNPTRSRRAFCEIMRGTFGISITKVGNSYENEGGPDEKFFLDFSVE